MEAGIWKMRTFGKALRIIWILVCVVVIGACGVFVYDVWKNQSFTAYAAPYEQYIEYKTGNFRYQSKLVLKSQLLADIGDGTGAQPVDMDMDMIYDGFMVDPYEHGYMDMHLSFLGLNATYASEIYQDVSGEDKLTFVRVTDSDNFGEWTRTQSFSPVINLPLLVQHDLFVHSSIEETEDGYVIYADAEKLIDILDLKGVINETLTAITGDAESEEAFKTAAQSSSAKYIFDKNYRLQEIQLLDFMYYTNSFAIVGIWTISFYDFDKVLLVDAQIPAEIKATAPVANDENVFWSFTDAYFGVDVVDTTDATNSNESNESSNINGVNTSETEVHD